MVLDDRCKSSKFPSFFSCVNQVYSDVVTGLYIVIARTISRTLIESRAITHKPTSTFTGSPAERRREEHNVNETAWNRSFHAKLLENTYLPLTFGLSLRSYVSSCNISSSTAVISSWFDAARFLLLRLWSFCDWRFSVSLLVVNLAISSVCVPFALLNVKYVNNS